MVHHIRPVVKGAPETFIVGDMTFGSYNVSCEQAITNENRLMKETGCDCIKLEGGIEMADKTAAIKIPILGIGAGPYVNCRVLVTKDLMNFTKKLMMEVFHYLNSVLMQRWKGEGVMGVLIALAKVLTLS